MIKTAITPRKRLKARKRRLQNTARLRERIVRLAHGKSITSEDVVRALHISSSAARRYIANLKNEEKI